MSEHVGSVTRRLDAGTLEGSAGDFTDGSVGQWSIGGPHREEHVSMAHRGATVPDVVEDSIANLLREGQPLTAA